MMPETTQLGVEQPLEQLGFFRFHSKVDKSTDLEVIEDDFLCIACTEV
jgi:hypothetical protein